MNQPLHRLPLALLLFAMVAGCARQEAGAPSQPARLAANHTTASAADGDADSDHPGEDASPTDPEEFGEASSEKPENPETQIASAAGSKPSASSVYKKEDDPAELAKAAESEKTRAENAAFRAQIAEGQGLSEKRPLEINFNDLKFPIELASKFDESQLTERVKLLEGKHIKIKGYIMPTFQQSGIEQFILLMNTNCKFGSAEDYAWCNIRVQMDEGKSASFTIRPVTVEGVLKLDPMEGPRDYHISLYYLNGTKVTE